MFEVEVGLVGCLDAWLETLEVLPCEFKSPCHFTSLPFTTYLNVIQRQIRLLPLQHLHAIWILLYPISSPAFRKALLKLLAREPFGVS